MEPEETLAVKSNRERIGVLETKTETMEAITADHETRMRARERLEFQILAYCLVGSTIGGVIATIVALLMVR